jgi:hypothetical protein
LLSIPFRSFNFSLSLLNATEGPSKNLAESVPGDHLAGTEKLPAEYQQWITAYVVTDKTFSSHQGLDLADFEGQPPSNLPLFRVTKQELYIVFKSRIARHFDYEENRIRLWILDKRDSGTIRPKLRIPEGDHGLCE